MLLAWGAALGCASPNYRCGQNDAPAGGRASRWEIARGGESPRLDRIERVLKSPSRLKWIPDARPDVPSDETLSAVERYLAENGIADLTIAINEYEPRRQWERVQANHQLGAGWKYSLGSVNWMLGTLLPARVFDRTTYNPYSNTLVVNSDDLPEILAAAAYAKDLRNRRLRGPYALMASLPVLSMVHQVSAASDVLSYARHHGDWELEEAAYRCLYPRLGAQGAVVVVSVPSLLLQPVVAFGGGLVGRSIAEIQISRLQDSRPVRGSTSPEDTLWARFDADDPETSRRVMPVDAVFQSDEELRRVSFPEP